MIHTHFLCIVNANCVPCSNAGRKKSITFRVTLLLRFKIVGGSEPEFTNGFQKLLIFSPSIRLYEYFDIALLFLQQQQSLSKCHCNNCLCVHMKHGNMIVENVCMYIHIYTYILIYIAAL